MKDLQIMIAAIPTKIRALYAMVMAIVVMLAPQAAYAAGANMIDQAFNIVQNQVLYRVYWGLVGIVAVTALIIIIVELLCGVFDPDGQKRSGWIKRAAIVLAICFVAAFAPLLVNWVIDQAGTGTVSGVNVAK